jgi:hypothetical protein
LTRNFLKELNFFAIRFVTNIASKLNAHLDA